MRFLRGSVVLLIATAIAGCVPADNSGTAAGLVAVVLETQAEAEQRAINPQVNQVQPTETEQLPPGVFRDGAGRYVIDAEGCSGFALNRVPKLGEWIVDRWGRTYRVEETPVEGSVWRIRRMSQ